MSYVKLFFTLRIITNYLKLSGISFHHCTVQDGTLEYHMFSLATFSYQHGGVNLKPQKPLFLQICGKIFQQSIIRLGGGGLCV